MSGPRLFRLSLDVWSLWPCGPDLNVTCGELSLFLFFHSSLQVTPNKSGKDSGKKKNVGKKELLTS